MMRARAPGPPPSGRTQLLGVILLAGSVCAGCASPSGPPAPIVAATLVGSGVYAQSVAAAQQDASQGRLPEALFQLRVAEAVAPDRVKAARDAASAEARLTAAADAAEQAGDRAAKAGQTAVARAAYTRALELDPKRPGPRAYLQAAEARSVTADMSKHSGSGSGRRRSGKTHAKGRSGRKPHAATP